MNDIIKKLADGKVLPRENKDDPLTGNYMGTRECHIQPDWLLVYEISEKNEIRKQYSLTLKEETYKTFFGFAHENGFSFVVNGR